MMVEMGMSCYLGNDHGGEDGLSKNHGNIWLMKWLLHGYYMVNKIVLIWSLYGYYIAIIWLMKWLLYGYYMVIVWLLYGY